MAAGLGHESFFDAAAVFLKVWTRIKQARAKEGDGTVGAAPEKLLREPGVTRERLELLVNWGLLECIFPDLRRRDRKQKAPSPPPYPATAQFWR